MSTRKRTRLAACAVGVAVLITGGVAGSALAADVTSSSVKAIRVLNRDGSALAAAGVSIDHPVRIELDVKLPETAIKDDLIAFKMPASILGVDMGFNILEKSSSTGAVIGRCETVSRTVTCKMNTAYFDTYKGAEGTLVINDRLDANVAANGVTVPLDFGITGVANPSVVVNGYAPLELVNATKTGRLTATGVEWEVRTALKSERTFPIKFQDYPDASMDCSAAVAQIVAYTDLGNDSKRTVIGTSAAVANPYGGYDFTIEAAVAAAPHAQLGLIYGCKIVDRVAPDFVNTGFVSDGGGQFMRSDGKIQGGAANGAFALEGKEAPPGSSAYIMKIGNPRYAPAVVTEKVTGQRYREQWWSPSAYRSGSGGATATTITISGKGTPGDVVEVYRDRWISGPETTVEPNCSDTVTSKGTWSCESSLDAYPDEFMSGSWNNASVQALRMRTLVKGPIAAPNVDEEFRSKTGIISPLAIDFEGNATVQTVNSTTAPATFDILGDGKQESSGWLAPSAGFVAVDLDRDGQISSLDELFGGSVGDGFAKLAKYDTNGDGAVDSSDEGYSELLIWRDANMNKVVDSGELVTLAEAGVISLSLDHTDFKTVDSAGNVLYERSTAVLSNGSTAALNDVYFRMG